MSQTVVAERLEELLSSVEPQLARVPRAVGRFGYPSVPPANGWRASAAPSRTVMICPASSKHWS